MLSVLITGGTGAFGRAFTEKLLSENKYDRICIYSRDEAKQADMRIQFKDDGRLRFFIGDIRDKDRLKEAMREVDVVVHGAALKRVETCEYSPIEAMKTNVVGSANVIEAANFTKVKKVVALSTDKAANPRNLYGASKLMAEKMFLAANNMHGEHGPIYSVVKYGNIFNSTGSVVPTWKKILSESDTVPVTDGHCTRYFMYLSEAVDLVQGTICSMKGGEVNIPDLPAYQLSDLATAMGAKMKITGLPLIEKQHETMNGLDSSEFAQRMSVNDLQEALRMI